MNNQSSPHIVMVHLDDRWPYDLENDEVRDILCFPSGRSPRSHSENHKGHRRIPSLASSTKLGSDESSSNDDDDDDDDNFSIGDDVFEPALLTVGSKGILTLRYSREFSKESEGFEDDTLESDHLSFSTSSSSSSSSSSSLESLSSLSNPKEKDETSEFVETKDCDKLPRIPFELTDTNPHKMNENPFQGVVSDLAAIFRRRSQKEPLSPPPTPPTSPPRPTITTKTTTTVTTTEIENSFSKNLTESVDSTRVITTTSTNEPLRKRANSKKCAHVTKGIIANDRSRKRADSKDSTLVSTTIRKNTYPRKRIDSKDSTLVVTTIGTNIPPRNRIHSKDSTLISATPTTFTTDLHNDDDNDDDAIRIRLRPEDEIHASPCQCALNFAGPLNSLLLPSTPPPSMSASLRSRDSSATESFILKIKRHKLVNSASASAKDTVNDSIISNQTISMEPSMAESAEQHHLSLGGPPPPESPLRTNKTFTCPSYGHQQDDFSFVDFHEIILLRLSFICNASVNDEDRWRSMTIRCRDHDEMDTLIGQLKQSSKSKVVPFSLNPKAKLRDLKSKRGRERVLEWLAGGEKRKRLKKPETPRCHPVSTTTPTASTPPTITQHSKNHFHNKDKCEFCDETFSIFHRRHHCRKCFRSCCSDCSSLYSTLSTLKETRYCHVCDLPHSFKRVVSPRQKFHNQSHCELCTLHFTILTRRHHCRRCNRSVCDNCSNVMLVKGGEMSRYCNKCKHKMRYKLNRLWNKTPGGALLNNFPGRIHSECMGLGVGVMGKLPHWKHYLYKNEPALGRLTVELIEALALPTVDYQGRIDPYVRATITGYDHDLKLNLVEWFPHKRYSLCSTFCHATTSPVWTGPGKHGGELLTLPVLRTAGAVLRLEVMHYDTLTNYKGKDVVLGVVEIPLSDLPNANLRQPRHHHYDGFVKRWYGLWSPLEVKKNGVVMAVPIEEKKHPLKDDVVVGDQQRKQQQQKPKFKSPTPKQIVANGLESWEELVQRMQGLVIAPVEWISSALDLDIPRRPIANDYLRRSQSPAVHVRLKLNVSETGDLLSHAWFPLIPPVPEIAPYDPEVLWSLILRLKMELEPYFKAAEFFDGTVKWKHPATTCITAVSVLLFHIYCIRYFLLLLHLYVFVFLASTLRPSSPSSSSYPLQPHDDSLDKDDSQTISPESKTTTRPASTKHSKEKLISSSSDPTAASTSTTKAVTTDHNDNHSGSASAPPTTSTLNKTVSWIAKILGDNRGLEILQSKLETMLEDVRNVNSVWDGTSLLKTKGVMAGLVASFVLHCVFWQHHRWIWILGLTVAYFGQSPWCILKVRMLFGFHRGVAQILKRRNMHTEELNRVKKRQ